MPAVEGAPIDRRLSLWVGWLDLVVIEVEGLVIGVGGKATTLKVMARDMLGG